MLVLAQGQHISCAIIVLKVKSLDFHVFLTLAKYSLETLSLLTVQTYDIFSSCPKYLITFSLVHLLYFYTVHFKMLSIMFDLSLFNDKMCTSILTKIHPDSWENLVTSSSCFLILLVVELCSFKDTCNVSITVFSRSMTL